MRHSIDGAGVVRDVYVQRSFRVTLNRVDTIEVTSRAELLKRNVGVRGVRAEALPSSNLRWYCIERTSEFDALLAEIHVELPDQPIEADASHRERDDRDPIGAKNVGLNAHRFLACFRCSPRLHLQRASDHRHPSVTRRQTDSTRTT